MQSIILSVDGMRCEGCAQTIKALIGSEAGVRAAEVFYQDRQARILYDPKTVGADRLVQVIEQGGYRVPAGEP